MANFFVIANHDNVIIQKKVFEKYQEVRRLKLNWKNLIGNFIVAYLVLFWARIAAEVFEVVFGSWWLLPVYIMATIALSFVNIPLYRTKEKDKVGINVGGCILPMVLSIYLLYEIREILASIAATMIITTIIVIIIAWKSSRYVAGQGVLSRAFTIPLISTLAVYLVTYGTDITGNLLFLRLALGYAISTIAVIVGTDLFHMHEIGKDHRFADDLSMGGAGILDGVWLTGVLTMVFVTSLNHISFL